MQVAPAVWLVVVTEQVIVQLGQDDAFGSVGSVELLVATVSQYRFAPVTLDQLKLGVVDNPVAPLAGEDSVGAGSNCAAAPRGAQNRASTSTARQTG